MANFTSYQDFFGRYGGDYDGRQATLEIKDVKADSVYPLFRIALTDLDRNEVHVGTHEERGQHGYIITDIPEPTWWWKYGLPKQALSSHVEHRLPFWS